MRRTLSTIALAVLTVGLLGSCSKINERLDNLDKRVDGIENEQIATINGQIANIESSIKDLGQIRSDISNLKQSAEAHGEDIFALQEADETLGNRIDNLEDYLENVLPNYAEKEWVKATFSTLEQYDSTCTAIAEINAKIGGLDTKLSKDIKACADSMTEWINVKFKGYYTAAKMDADLAKMRASIDSAKASGKISDTKADSVAAELTKTKTAVDTAKSHIRSEYKAAIKSAIETSEGKLTKELTDKIATVNTAVTNLTKRVDNIQNKVDDLLSRVEALENMIQSVTIVPAFSDGSVKVEDNILLLDCIISPKEAVDNLKKEHFTVILSETPDTKVLSIAEIQVTNDFWFKANVDEGTVELQIPIDDYRPDSADNTLSVALNVEAGISNYTTEFEKVTVSGAPKGAIKGKFSISSSKQVHFSKGNLQYVKEGSKWQFSATQYQIVETNDQNVGTNYADAPIQTLFGFGDNTSKTSTINNDYTWPSSGDPWGSKIDNKGTWRALTINEWLYIFGINGNKGTDYRDVENRFAKATVDEVPGILIFPDVFVWDSSMGRAPEKYNVKDEDFAINSYSVGNLVAMQTAGVVFLPASGSRGGKKVSNVGVKGYYSSSTTEYNTSAGNYIQRVFAFSTFDVFDNYVNKSTGYSVRLVTEVPTAED